MIGRLCVKKALAIFKRDIKRLLCNPVALVITIGVCIIPSLLCVVQHRCNWDPYGNTQNIKIAVANNDKGTTNDLVGELNAGDEVIDKLKDNDQLGWTIVDSEKEAKEGVEAGKYYAALVIPSDFSEGMLSMLSRRLPPAQTDLLRQREEERRCRQGDRYGC